MLIPITVHVPEHLVSRFYAQFGAFIQDPEPETPTHALPKRLETGDRAPAWVDSENAADLAFSLWNKLSGPGQSVLLFMSRETKDVPRYFQPTELAEGLNHPHGASGIAGILGGVGRAIRAAALPEYATPRGGAWHYIWDWDGAVYTMTPEVAKLLRKAHNRR